MEPPSKGHFGTSHVVPCTEAVLFSEVERVLLVIWEVSFLCGEVALYLSFTVVHTYTTTGIHVHDYMYMLCNIHVHVVILTNVSLFFFFDSSKIR